LFWLLMELLINQLSGIQFKTIVMNMRIVLIFLKSTIISLIVSKKCLAVIMTEKVSSVLVLTPLLTLIIFKWKKSQIILLPFETDGVVKLYCLRISLKLIISMTLFPIHIKSVSITFCYFWKLLNKLNSIEVLNT